MRRGLGQRRHRQSPSRPREAPSGAPQSLSPCLLSSSSDTRRRATRSLQSSSGKRLGNVPNNPFAHARGVLLSEPIRISLKKEYAHRRNQTSTHCIRIFSYGSKMAETSSVSSCHERAEPSTFPLEFHDFEQLRITVSTAVSRTTSVPGRNASIIMECGPSFRNGGTNPTGSFCPLRRFCSGHGPIIRSWRTSSQLRPGRMNWQRLALPIHRISSSTIVRYRSWSPHDAASSAKLPSILTCETSSSTSHGGEEATNVLSVVTGPTFRMKSVSFDNVSRPTSTRDLFACDIGSGRPFHGKAIGCTRLKYASFGSDDEDVI